MIILTKKLIYMKISILIPMRILAGNLEILSHKPIKLSLTIMKKIKRVSIMKILNLNLNDFLFHDV